MKRVTLYSSSTRPSASRSPSAPSGDATVLQTAQSPTPNRTTGFGTRLKARVKNFCIRWQRPLLIVSGALFAFLLVFLNAHMTAAPHEITQRDIDIAVRRTLEKKPLPSNAARAYKSVQASVVRVRRFGNEKLSTGKVGTGQSRQQKGNEKGTEVEEGTGSGVVITDKGIILTNMHVVAGADRIGLVFADGSESDAAVISLRPEDDLAVLQAKTIPDDLFAATLGTTKDLAPGDEVIAVGFPFGFGPSVSSGVVSGLKREFRSPKGERVLTNLIQFDAAANPGNSGGPLVTSKGEVVGIVTAILNPTRQGVFVGIGFAVPIENAAAAVGVPPF